MGKFLVIGFVIGFLVILGILGSAFMITYWDSLYPEWDRIGTDEIVLTCLVSSLGGLGGMLVTIWIMD